MMRTKLVYLSTWPYDILCWIALLFLWSIWGTKLHWINGVWFEWKKGSYFDRTWASRWGGCCLGHGGFYGSGASGGSGIDTLVEKHEHIHVRQCELIMMYGFVIALVLAFTSVYYLGIIFWVLSWPLVYVLSLLHGSFQGAAYKNSIMEKSAVALAEEWYTKKLGN